MSGLGAVLSSHARSLVTVQSVLPWGHRRSVAIGVSCLYFCAPAFVRPSLRWPLQAYVSLMSDYYRSGLPSAWHVADRWLASANVLVQIARALHLLPVWQVALLATPPLSCKYLGSRRVAQRDYDGYRALHISWHVLASLVCVIVEHAQLTALSGQS